MLGDLNARKRSEKGNTHLRFGQGLVHEAYLLFLYELFKDYCLSAPKKHEHFLKSTNKSYSTINFQTYSLACFNEFYNLFYVNGVKTVPNNIAELLTPQALAMWSQDDGNKLESGFTLNTHSYTKGENLLLIQALKSKLNLNCSLHKQSKYYKIFIKKDSMDKFRVLVTPYFHESMLYKLK